MAQKKKNLKAKKKVTVSDTEYTQFLNEIINRIYETANKIHDLKEFLPPIEEIEAGLEKQEILSANKSKKMRKKS